MATNERIKEMGILYVVEVKRILSINGGWDSNIGYPIGISVFFYTKCPNLIEIGPEKRKLHAHTYLASTR